MYKVTRQIRYLFDSFIYLLSEVLVLNYFYNKAKTTSIYIILKLYLTTPPIGSSQGSAVGHRLLTVGHWLLAISYQLLAIGCQLLVIGCWLLVIPLGRHHLLTLMMMYLPIFPTTESRQQQGLTSKIFTHNNNFFSKRFI